MTDIDRIYTLHSRNVAKLILEQYPAVHVESLGRGRSRGGIPDCPANPTLNKGKQIASVLQKLNWCMDCPIGESTTTNSSLYFVSDRCC